MSKLPTSKAAALLGLMPGDRARHIAYAMSKTTSVKADAIARIGAGLAQNYCGAALPAFTDSAESRIGAILNSSPAATRDQVLEGLLSDDPTFGEGVRKAIFTFADIPARLAIPDVPKVLRDIDPADLVRALASATGAGGLLADAANHTFSTICRPAWLITCAKKFLRRGKSNKAMARPPRQPLLRRSGQRRDSGTIKLAVEDEE